MKILIVISMVIIFISVFFILFILDTTIKKQAGCMESQGDGCNSREMVQVLIFAVTFIAMFLIIDSTVLYIVIKSITADTSSYLALGL